jgi:hypothetical protein
MEETRRSGVLLDRCLLLSVWTYPSLGPPARDVNLGTLDRVLFWERLVLATVTESELVD